MKKAVLCGLLILPLMLLAQKKKTSAAAGAKNSYSALTKSISNGQVVYQKFCLTCHQVDGSGVPNLNPPLTRTKWTLGSKAILIHQVLNGSHGTVEIDGDTFHNTMPPLGQALTDQQVADVLTYVRNNFGNKASAVTPAEVKNVRAKTK
jgi:mono/diheme cytochrome c family protein